MFNFEKPISCLLYSVALWELVRSACQNSQLVGGVPFPKQAWESIPLYSQWAYLAKLRFELHYQPFVTSLHSIFYPQVRFSQLWLIGHGLVILYLVLTNSCRLLNLGSSEMWVIDSSTLHTSLPGYTSVTPPFYLSLDKTAFQFYLLAHARAKPLHVVNITALT